MFVFLYRKFLFFQQSSCTLLLCSVCTKLLSNYLHTVRKHVETYLSPDAVSEAEVRKFLLQSFHEIFPYVVCETELLKLIALCGVVDLFKK